MSRLFVGNFDFDWSFGHPRQTLPRRLDRAVRELAFSWLAIAEPDDWILSPGKVTTEDWTDLGRQFPRPLPHLVSRWDEAPPDVELVPWGWTENLVAAWSTLHRPLPPHPPLDLVRTVNSRQFSTDLEALLGCGPPHVAFLSSREALLLHLARYCREAGPGAAWLLKANASHAGRDRMKGRGPTLSPAQLRWLERQFQTTAGIAFEPWLEIVCEAALLWNIPPGDPPRLAGIAPLLTEPAGGYRGSLFAQPTPWDALWEEAVVVTHRAALFLQAAGYFGPVGIDACWYRDGNGRLRCRPLQDINARWTMGWLSLGWREGLDAGEFGVWLQQRQPPRQPASRHEQIIRVTPGRLDGLPVGIQQSVHIWRAAAEFSGPGR